MKFAHSFSQVLDEEDFPADWQAAAIRYKQLKKCIKKVQQELCELGLTAEILRSLVQQNSDPINPAAKHSPLFQYLFDGTVQCFQPKLVLTIDAVNGIPLDLNLSEETRRSLENIVQQKLGNITILELDDDEESQSDSDSGPDSPGLETSFPGSELPATSHPCKKKSVSNIEITLYSDSEFFHLLTSELASLEALQNRAEAEIKSKVLDIGGAVTGVAAPKSTNSKSDLYPWREIFRVYVESGIFFSNLECENHEERTVEKAQEQLAWFNKEIFRLGLQTKFKNPYSSNLLRRFMDINMDVLRVMRFQAINKIAMTKILKKFDKRTALGARETFPEFISSDSFLASHLAKAICYTMSSSLLNLIPQLDDYLCPICSSISVKPVRLSCSHVFCVRCLVKLQRAKTRRCPMCRSDAVLTADSTNLDMGLLAFLKEYFPKEAKLKQQENEKEVAMEQWKSVHHDMFGGSSRDSCAIM